VIEFFVVKDYQGSKRVICGNAVDVIYENNPRNKETKIITRSGATIVTCEPFNDVMKKFDNCLRMMNVRSDNNVE
jgi:hypothetical protein